MSSIGVYSNLDDCDERRENDWYPTPWQATEAFMMAEQSFLNEYNRVDEPACGDGSMSEVIRGHGKEVYSSDLIYRGYGVGDKDFLKLNENPTARCLITNPPFLHAEDFIKIAHKKKYEYIAMLLKSNYFHTQGRLSLFRDYRPVRVYPLSWRVDFTGGGANHFDCIWVVWIPSESGKTEYCAPLEKPKYLSQASLL